MNKQMFDKCKAAALGGWEAVSVMSTSESLVTALVCNRCDWLTRLGYTIPEALTRVGEWAHDVSAVASELEADGLLPMHN